MSALLFLQATLALALAALFLSAVRHKLSERLRFAAQLAEYQLLPERLVPTAVWALVGLELTAACTLLWRGSWPVAGALAAGLLALYAAAIAINLLRGRSHIDCGCGDTPVLLSYWLVLRNALLAGGAAVLLLPATGDAALLSWLAILPGALVLILCYVAMAQLLDNASSLREWRTGS